MDTWSYEQRKLWKSGPIDEGKQYANEYYCFYLPGGVCGSKEVVQF